MTSPAVLPALPGSAEAIFHVGDWFVTVWYGIRLSARANPSLPVAEIRRLIDVFLAGNWGSYNSSDVAALRALAGNGSCPEDLLERVAARGAREDCQMTSKFEIEDIVPRHPNCPPARLASGVHSDVAFLRAAAGRNPALPEGLAVLLLADADVNVLRFVLLNQAVPVRLMAVLLGSSNPLVLQPLLGRLGGCPERQVVVDRLVVERAAVGDLQLGLLIARYSVRAEQISALCMDPSAFVLEVAAANPLATDVDRVSAALLAETY